MSVEVHYPRVETVAGTDRRGAAGSMRSMLYGYKGACSCSWRGPQQSPNKQGRASAERAAIAHAASANAKRQVPG